MNVCYCGQYGGGKHTHSSRCAPRTLYIHVGLQFETHGVAYRVADVFSGLPVVRSERNGHLKPCALEEIAPWASRFVSVDGGWMAYESSAEFESIEAST